MTERAPVQRCTACGAQVVLRPAVCPRCAATTFVPMSVTHGRLVAATTVLRGSGLGAAIDAPYRVGLVALDGGGRMLTLIAGAAGIGDAVTLEPAAGGQLIVARA